MPKAKSETQLFRLAQMLAGGAVVQKATIVSTLGVKESSVPVYIHSLKKKFGAEIDNVTEGRVVVGYVLKNELSVPQFKRAATPSSGKKSVATASDGVPILDSEVDTNYSERELRDTVESLGYTPNGEY